MITEIKWNNHPVLGNLELKFTKPDGTPYNTIVIAGENGTGKTTILETLSEFLNLGSFKSFEYIKYRVDGEIYKIIPHDGVEFGFHERIKESDNSRTTVNSNRNNKKVLLKPTNWILDIMDVHTVKLVQVLIQNL